MAPRASAALLVMRFIRLPNTVRRLFGERPHERVSCLRSPLLGEAGAFLDAPDQLFALAADHSQVVFGQMPPFFTHLPLVLLPLPFQLFEVHCWSSPLRPEPRPLAPGEPLLMIAFERPQRTHAMRLPARGPILKLSRESDMRRSAGLPPMQTLRLPPCNFAAVSPDFPRRAVRFQG